MLYSIFREKYVKIYSFRFLSCTCKKDTVRQFNTVDSFPTWMFCIKFGWICARVKKKEKRLLGRTNRRTENGLRIFRKTFHFSYCPSHNLKFFYNKIWENYSRTILVLLSELSNWIASSIFFKATSVFCRCFKELAHIYKLSTSSWPSRSGKNQRNVKWSACGWSGSLRIFCM